jgi:predicted enzyme related to lactoylglutathione lyase
MADSLKGRFVWHELMTTDPKGAQAFYPAVTGWAAAPWGNDGKYSLWMNGEAPVGGCMALPGEVQAAGIPAHWLTYIGTPDLDRTCAEIKQLGGAIMREPETIPDVGRFAVVTDPQGGVFCLYTPASPRPGADQPPRVGDFSWHELATTNPAGALAFYGSLFGWEQTSEFDMGPMGTYHLYGIGGVPMGGIYPKPADVPVSNWLPYARVSSADGAADTIKSTGGRVLQGPVEVPGGDRIAVAMDPQGAVFAVHSSKPV